MTRSEPIKALRTSLRIIQVLAETGGIGVSELEDRLDMPSSTLYDYLRTLCEEGYAMNENGEYRLSLRFLEIGGWILHRQQTLEVTRRELRSIANETGEHAYYVVEEEGYGYLLHTESGGRIEGAVHRIGTRTYLHTYAAGKAMLAYFSEEKRQEIFDRHGLIPVSENTITDEEELRRELEQTRERGYATDREEVLAGMRGVAAPVVTADGLVHGSIGVYGPSGREISEELVQLIQEEANVIEAEIYFR